jgi:hypothetical protein
MLHEWGLVDVAVAFEGTPRLHIGLIGRRICEWFSGAFTRRSGCARYKWRMSVVCLRIRRARSRLYPVDDIRGFWRSDWATTDEITSSDVEMRHFGDFDDSPRKRTLLHQCMLK